MASDPFGVSFVPTGAGGSKPQNAPGQRPTPVQQAIQTLSLRIPKTAGASAFAPQALLNSAGSGALGGNPNDASVLEQIRRMLFGGRLGTQPMPMAPDPGTMTPYGTPPTPDSGWPAAPAPTPFQPAPAFRPQPSPMAPYAPPYTPNITPGGTGPRDPDPTPGPLPSPVADPPEETPNVPFAIRPIPTAPPPFWPGDNGLSDDRSWETRQI